MNSNRLLLSALVLVSANAGLDAQAVDLKLSDSVDPVLRWNQATLDAISQSAIGPTPVSRAIALTSTSMFDAWAAYDSKARGTQLCSTLKVSAANINQKNTETAISFAAYRTLSNLFPNQQAIFDTLMSDLGHNPNLASTELIAGLDGYNEAVVTGNIAAKALLDFRANDGANQANGYVDTTGYRTVNTWNEIRDPEKWQPISIDNGENVQEFLTPHWNRVTPFALKSAGEFLPPAPEPYLDRNGNINQGYIDQALEVIDYSAELTDEEKVIAEYWADGPNTVLPPGHSQLFGQFVSIRDNLSLDENVKLFFGLGNAVMDAGIAAWDAKITFDYVRPITAIRYLADNNLLPTEDPNVRLNVEGETEIYAWGGPEQGSQWILGKDWLPYQDINFLTPPFAEYVSGHSTFSAAAAEVLKQYTGSDAFGLCYTELADSSTFEANTPAAPVNLCWDTFTEAADEAGISRLYGGIHFRDGDVNGRAMGRAIGDAVWKKSLLYINGELEKDAASVPEPGVLAGLVLMGLGGARWRRKQSVS